MKSFLIKLFVFSALLACLEYAWHTYAPAGKHMPYPWITLAFFILITALFHYLAIRTSKGKPQSFIRFYMASTALRMVLYMIIILAFRYIAPPVFVPFAIGFMVHYFAFTVFETPLLLNELKKAENGG